MDQTNPTPSSLNAGENACVCSPPLGMGEQAAVAAAPPPPQTCRAGSPGSERPGSRCQAPPAPARPPASRAEGREEPQDVKKLPGTLEIAQSNLCSAFPMQRGPRLQHASQPGKQAHSHRSGALGQPPGAGGGGVPSRPQALSTQGLICISNMSQTSPYFPLQLLLMIYQLA